jgi:SMC interacting uncharacterized protein involved in chromosome segregation
MNTEQTKYTPESVWQFLMEMREQMKINSAEADKERQELREQMKTSSEETNKSIKELSANIDKNAIDIGSLTAKIDRTTANIDKNAISIKETERILKEQSAELDKKFKETNRHINGIAKSNGDMTEEAIFNALERDLIFGGIEFDAIDKNKKRHLKKLNLRGQYDVVLENGNTVALIEAKYKVRKEDITDLFAKEVADKFRKLFPLYVNHKIILGVGGMSFDDDALDEASKSGVGIIKVVGDKVEYYTDGIKTY